MQPAIIDKLNRRDHERFEAYRLYEEKTDIGERLSLPIHNTPRLEVIDGGVYGYGVDGALKRMTDWSDEAYSAAVRDPNFSGPNQVELVRRKLEYEEALQVETLLPGECLLAMSPIPDAVMDGQTDINGYRTDLARTFYRAYYRHEDHVETMTLSLEQSNKRALRAVGDVTGMNLPDSMQSEEVLAARHKTSMSHKTFDSLGDLVRYHYDASLFEQTGRTFFAGNRLAGRQDSMRFIDNNHDIIDEHMSFLRSIEARVGPGSLRDSELEKLRWRTAAALDERLHGGIVTSIADASVSNRMESNEYGGECTTGASQSTQEQMGLAQGKHTTNCPLCGTQGVTATVEGETITCSDCKGSVNICTGKVSQGKPRRVDDKQSQIQSTQKIRVPDTKKSAQLSVKQQMIEASYGRHMEVRSRTGICSTYEVVIHKYTGEVVARL